MYREKFIVQPSETGPDGRLKLKSLLDCFQNIAGRAAAEFEGSTTELFSQGYSWVLSRYEIDFTAELPKIDEAFTIRTYHDPSQGYNTLRMFHVEIGGAEIVRAKSAWLLVDVKTKRALKACEHLPAIKSDDEIDRDFIEIPEPEDFECVRNIDVTWHSLDYNGHVNNAVYFQWIYDEISRMPKKICASFRSGAKNGETVRLEKCLQGGTVLFRIMRDNVRKPSAKFMAVIDNG